MLGWNSPDCHWLLIIASSTSVLLKLLSITVTWGALKHSEAQPIPQSGRIRSGEGGAPAPAAVKSSLGGPTVRKVGEAANAILSL